ncbi:hypothetical protein [Microbispora sp. H11081]|uniref:hypothetical protein n=1 Tax=Microbispora sp. H11081 TaxID=2729107 RepID=UPI0014743CDF|nr:hypothetical protein [Microbispora sp. H11081]
MPAVPEALALRRPSSRRAGGLERLAGGRAAPVADMARRVHGWKSPTLPTSRAGFTRSANGDLSGRSAVCRWCG